MVAGSRSFSGILVVGFVLAMLLPILTTAYLGDDTFNSSLNGVLSWYHISFAEWLARVNGSFVAHGRFDPVALLEANWVFNVVPSLAVYKVFQVLITVLNVFTFVVLLRAFRLPRALSLLAVVVLLCSFQMR